jgi:hypothetical protein
MIEEKSKKTEAIRGKLLKDEEKFDENSLNRRKSSSKL